MAKEPEPGSKILFALHEVMGKVGYIQKKSRNDFQKYNYAGEADLLETLRPAMVEAGLILIPSGQERSEIDQHGITSVTVEYTLAHKDGEVWPEKIRAYGAGGDKNKNGVGDKGLYKALTGANKYLLFKLFQIETGDDPEVTNEQEKLPGEKPQKPTVTVDEDSYLIKIEGYKDPEAKIRAWTKKFCSMADLAADLDDLKAMQVDNMKALDHIKKQGLDDPIVMAIAENNRRLSVGAE